MPPQSCINVAIVEDHPIFRQAIASAINSTQGMVVSWVADDIDECLNSFAVHRPDILLVDLGLPSGSGLILIHEVHRRWGESCICAVLTMTGNDAHLFKAIRAGARGYFFKSDDECVWIDGIRTLANGGAVIHGGLARHLQGVTSVPIDPTAKRIFELLVAGYHRDEVACRLSLTGQEVAIHQKLWITRIQDSSPCLSGREAELLGLLNQGCSFRQSAEQMNIQESTAKTLAARAYQKLGASNLQEALYAARREHLFR